MDGTGNYYAKWSISDSERHKHMLDFHFYMSTDCKTKSDNKGENKFESSYWGWKTEDIQHKEKLLEWKGTEREVGEKNRERGVKLKLK